MTKAALTQITGDSQESCMTNADMTTAHSAQTAWLLRKAVTGLRFISPNRLLNFTQVPENDEFKPKQFI